MKKSIFIALLLVTFGCTELKVDSRLIGEWETDKILSQLGESVTYQEFKKDGTFVLRSTFIQAKMTLSDEGTFKTEGNKLILKSREKTSTQTFTFEGDELVINDGNDTFRFKRKT